MAGSDGRIGWVRLRTPAGALRLLDGTFTVTPTAQGDVPPAWVNMRVSRAPTDP
jgi:hypothetical protein